MITKNIGDYEILQHVSIILLLIYLFDIKHVHSSLQCQTMITTNIDDYENLQHVSIIYLLIYLFDIKHVHSSLKYQPMITTILVIMKIYRT